MNEQKKQKLLEQYDDAAFALLMDEYAEEEGARLMAEFEAAQAAGQVPQMPAELDEQCRRMIRRDRAKKRGIRAARSFQKAAVKAAVAVLVFIGLMTTVVMSVDALRIPILNYFIEHYEKYSSLNIEGYDGKTPEHNNTTAPYAEVNKYEDPIAEYMPYGYISIYYNNSENCMTCIYKNDNGERINFEILPAYDEYRFDTENATCENISVMGYDAILAVGDSVVLVWCDDISGLIYNLSATDIPEEQLIELAQKIIIHFQEK